MLCSVQPPDACFLGLSIRWRSSEGRLNGTKGSCGNSQASATVDPTVNILPIPSDGIVKQNTGTISWAFCMTAQTILPMGIFTEGVNWGIAYDLPNRTTFTEYFKDKPNYILRRRHRRDLYSKAEVIMDSMGFDGRACIFRALCEASRLSRKSPTLSEQLIRLVFKFPAQAILESEPVEHRLYHLAYRRGRENKQQDCSGMFPACSISLIDLALGYYNDYLEEPRYQAPKPDL